MDSSIHQNRFAYFWLVFSPSSVFRQTDVVVRMSRNLSIWFYRTYTVVNFSICIG